MGTIPLSVLFSALKTKLVALLTRAAHPRWSTRFSRHLLLLSQGLLPCVLSRSARVRGGRRPVASISRRDCVPADSAKPASLLSLRRAHIPDHSLVRRHSRFLV